MQPAERVLPGAGARTGGDSLETVLVVADEIIATVRGIDRGTEWELVARQPLAFPTHHPQGLAFIGNRSFVSSVGITEWPRQTDDPAQRTNGRGTGHLFLLEGGTLLRDLRLDDGPLYHPGGIDFDGDEVWVPVAEYRADSRSVVLSVDPDTLAVRERFRVDDHVGWVVRDPVRDVVYGGTWGSRRILTWTTAGRELDRWANPSSFVDYQDCQFVAPGLLLCSGIANLPVTGGGVFELGGIALIDVPGRRIVHEFPMTLFTDAGHVVTRNPFAVTVDAGGLLLHVAPDDGDDLGGTSLLSYRPR